MGGRCDFGVRAGVRKGVVGTAVRVRWRLAGSRGLGLQHGGRLSTVVDAASASGHLHPVRHPNLACRRHPHPMARRGLYGRHPLRPCSEVILTLVYSCYYKPIRARFLAASSFLAHQRPKPVSCVIVVGGGLPRTCLIRALAPIEVHSL